MLACLKSRRIWFQNKKGTLKIFTQKNYLVYEE
jgi:hypothetical protein